MNVSRRVQVDFVQYRGDGSVLINVTPQLLADDGTVVGVSPTENVHTTQDALAALTEQNGAKEWGDAEVEQTISAATRPVTTREPIPEDERDGRDGPTTREVTVQQPRFPNLPVVW